MSHFCLRPSIYYERNIHSNKGDLVHCQSLGGEHFEFTDFDKQNQDVFNYLIANGGISNWILFVVILSHSIHLSTASSTDWQISVIWIDLRRAKNGKFYWPISGKQVEHRETKNIWWKGEPDGNGDCVLMDLFYSKHVKNSFWDWSCTGYLLAFSLCQIPFV